MDNLYRQMRADLRQKMEDDPTHVLAASHLLFVAHYLERICDHCTNIAERVAFMKTGRSAAALPGKFAAAAAPPVLLVPNRFP